LRVLTGLSGLAQNGHLVMLTPSAPGRGELEAKWDDVQEKRWVSPNGEALSCMHVREGNTSLVAVASKSGINILHNNESGFEVPLHTQHTYTTMAPNKPRSHTLPPNPSAPGVGLGGVLLVTSYVEECDLLEVPAKRRRFLLGPLPRSARFPKRATHIGSTPTPGPENAHTGDGRRCAQDLRES